MVRVSRLTLGVRAGLALGALLVALTLSLGAQARPTGVGTPCTVETCTLNVSQAQGVVTSAALLVAQAEGLFKKYGVNVNISISGGVNNTVVISGQSDITSGSPTNALILQAQGQQVWHLGGTSRDPGEFLIGGPQYKTL